MSDEEEIRKTARSAILSSWLMSFQKAMDCDTWGEPLVAEDIYKRISQQIEQESYPTTELFTGHEKSTEATSKAITLQDMKLISENFKLMKNDHQIRSNFPTDVVSVSTVTICLPNLQENDPDSEGTNNSSLLGSCRGNLLPAPPSFPGKTTLGIVIEKIALKSSYKYIDPFISVSVKDQNGVNVSITQRTPSSHRVENDCIIFNQTVYLQKPIEFLPLGFAVFFEFCHYKPKKKSTSTKCWTYIERDDMNDKRVSLELYKKPVDNRRKKLKLYSDRKVYFNVNLSLIV
ncbi:DgyrCDS11679 [Dimorphilus gyrociliatus]|uniref:DgyrCDS11679 n=1 Tax=Dimorphilus gyrociliatus TaxID=2664684 RepID=A0A7I8W510_9ANNE|nr:DgyrCDS11679 [Dimorphilus gyrociliatus]